MSKKSYKLYIAVADGDTIIGTIDELAEKFNLKKSTIYTVVSNGKCVWYNLKKYYVDELYEG